MIKMSLGGLLLLFLFLLFFGSNSYANTPIRVLLESNTSAAEITVTVTGQHTGYVDNQERFEANASLDWPVSASDGYLYVDGERLGQRFRINTLQDDHFVLEGNQYRGDILFVAKNNTVLVINVIEVEEYLRGVIGEEMIQSWPLEALKAQAVAARTYAINEIRSPMSSAEYDICASTACQLYKGVGAEHESTDRAVMQTQGLVLTFNGRIAETPYHADSGGRVASSYEVWSQQIPYLNTKEDFSYSSPFANWQFNFDGSEVAKLLAKQGYNIGNVQSMSIQQVSGSSRVTHLNIQGSAGSAELRGRVLQDWIRSFGLKSTYFEMVGPMTVRGQGFGHGVGMSQYGAKAQAANNKDFKAILAFYYPQTTMELYGATLASR